MSILIRGGTLVTATDTFGSDILIENEKIARIGPLRDPHLAPGECRELTTDEVRDLERAVSLVDPSGPSQADH